MTNVPLKSVAETPKQRLHGQLSCLQRWAVSVLRSFDGVGNGRE